MNDKGARRAYVYDTVVAQLSCHDAWAKGSVSTNIDPSDENNKSHPRIM